MEQRLSQSFYTLYSCIAPQIQPNDARQAQGRQARARIACQSVPLLVSLLLTSLFQLALAKSAEDLIAEDLIIHSGTDTEQTTVTHRSPASVAILPNGYQMAQHRARSIHTLIHTRANSLLVVELRGDCGWTAWSAHRQDEEPCTLLRRLARCMCSSCDIPCVDCCAGSGPRAPLLLRESTRIKGDKAGIRK